MGGGGGRVEEKEGGWFESEKKKGWREKKKRRKGKSSPSIVFAAQKKNHDIFFSSPLGASSGPLCSIQRRIRRPRAGAGWALRAMAADASTRSRRGRPFWRADGVELVAPPTTLPQIEMCLLRAPSKVFKSLLVLFSPSHFPAPLLLEASPEPSLQLRESRIKTTTPSMRAGLNPGPHRTGRAVAVAAVAGPSRRPSSPSPSTTTSGRSSKR